MSKKWVLGVALAAALAVPAVARGHAGHAHRVMGTVTMRHDNHVEVKTKDGKIVTITLTEKTTFARGKEKVDNMALHVGDRVVVEVDGKDSLTAKAVTLGTAAAAAKK
jgi:translation initiation factor IF-1